MIDRSHTADDGTPMNDSAILSRTAPVRTEHFDVVIAGAGISGVGGD